ncbi:MAG: DUF2752 domain-containing protein [Flavisolibacter sp.]
MIKKYSEPVSWILVLVLLFFMNGSKPAGSFCLFKLLGFHSCWGCGIGHAIHDALHFQFRQSVYHHILGIPAVAAIVYSIFDSFNKQKQNKIHGPAANANDVARFATG